MVKVESRMDLQGLSFPTHCWHKVVKIQWLIYVNNHRFDPIFKKDIVNMTSKCLKNERGKSMQILLNHMKANFLFNAKTSLMVSCIPMCSFSCEHCRNGYLEDQWDECKHNEEACD